MLSLIGIVTISLHSFIIITTIYYPLSNNYQFILKSFAKESKDIQLDEKLISKKQLLVKEMLDISSSNNNNNNNVDDNNQEKEIVEDKNNKQDTEKQELKTNNKDNKEKEKEEKKKEKKTKNKEERKIERKEDKGYEEDSWTKADQDLITKYNYRNLAIPKVYQTAPAH
jgi:flagellar biosynthesis GTPase FlhF